MTLSESTERVGPGGAFTVKLHLVNNVPQDLTNIDVYFSSDLFEDKQTIELFEDQEKDLEFTALIPRDAAPGDYVYTVRVFYDETLQTSGAGEFAVDENLDVSKNVETSSGFLWKKTVITITNNGNAVISDVAREELGVVERWFTSYSLDPSTDDELGRPTWTYTLAPGDQFALTITRDYRPFAIGILGLNVICFIRY